MFQKQPNTDGGEVAVSHFFVFQHPLEEPLQMGLCSLQPLTAPSQVGYVRGPLSENTTLHSLVSLHSQLRTKIGTGAFPEHCRGTLGRSWAAQCTNNGTWIRNAASSAEARKRHSWTKQENKDGDGVCWVSQSPVILSNDSQQLPADACIEAADATCGLLDLGHLVLILKVDGLR